ncbi:hypothetical protein H0H93_014012 [Arthromyces matolae]|nr:hypothetical protein H0H93_014012 [Arthromyces matolae]
MKFPTSTTIAITLLCGSGLLSVAAMHIPKHGIPNVPHISADRLEKVSHKAGQVVDTADRVTQQQQDYGRRELDSSSSLAGLDLERRGWGSIATGLFKMGKSEAVKHEKDIKEVGHVAEEVHDQQQQQSGNGKSRRALDYGVSEDLVERGWDEAYELGARGFDLDYISRYGTHSSSHYTINR